MSRPEVIRGSRRQRRLQQEAQAAHARKMKAIRLGVGGVLVSALTTGAVLLSRNAGADQQPPLTGNAASSDLIPSFPTLEPSAIAALTENDLWINDAQIGINRLPLDENRAIQKMDRVFGLMEKSQNKYLKEAIDFFYRLIDNDEIIVQMKPTIIGEVGMGSQAVEDNGKLKYLVQVSANEVLNLSNSITLAAAWAHEMEHVRSMKADFSAMDNSLTPQEKINRYLPKTHDPKEHVAEEARGNAIHTLAIIEARKLGYHGPINGMMERDVAMFETFGKDPTSQEWKNYIAVTYLHLPPGL